MSVKEPFKTKYRVREVRYRGGKIEFLPEIFDEISYNNQFGISFTPEENHWFVISDPKETLEEAQKELNDWRSCNEVLQTIVHEIN